MLRARAEPFVHLYLPVTSENARWGGVDVNGFPKFIATIDIMKNDNVTKCRLMDMDNLILGFNLENHPGMNVGLTWDMYGKRKDNITRTSFEIQGNIFESWDVGDAYLYFGSQKISEDLKGLLVSDKVVRIAMGELMSGTLRKPIYIEE